MQRFLSLLALADRVGPEAVLDNLADRVTDHTVVEYDKPEAQRPLSEVVPLAQALTQLPRGYHVQVQLRGHVTRCDRLPHEAVVEVADLGPGSSRR